ncbi:MAG: phosphohistidine phosphatase SixA [bacterium]
MNLFLLRHGDALPGSPDEARKLSQKGVKQIKKMAKVLIKTDVSFDLILSSPLIRAMQTAEIVADKFEGKIETSDVLSPGCKIEVLFQELLKHNNNSVLIVGHEPDFGHIIGNIIGTGHPIPLRKGGLVLIDIEDPNIQKGTLVWFLDPDIL